MKTFEKSLALQFLLLGGAVLGLGPGPALAQEVIYYHTDALGSPVATTDASGSVIERTEYEPFGKVLNHPQTDGPGYTGHISDAETGLSYMQQRYFDPGIGRFLSVDPVTADHKSGENFNRYWYANNNPYKFKDPDGRESACFSTGIGCGLTPITPEIMQKQGVAMAGLAATALAFVAPSASRQLLTWAGANSGAVSTATNIAAEAAGVTGTGIAANRLAGQAAEKLAAKELLAEGNTILGSQVAARTSEGLRFIDHLAQSPLGKIFGVEVKSGNGTRNAAQLAKDAKMATEGAVLTGKNAPEALRGQRLIIETVERRYPNE